MTKYPSLYAALEPSTAPDGKRGATVRCTATRRELGFVWWSSTATNGVVWNWRTGENFGERNTERNAVQALRDISNLSSGLPFSASPDPTPAPAPRRTPSPASAPVAAPTASSAPARRVVWDDEQAPGLTDAIAAALRARGQK